jgi:hypothetical protein
LTRRACRQSDIHLAGRRTLRRCRAGYDGAVKKTKDQFMRAYARLERLAPTRVSQALLWLHGPQARPVRIPLAILCLIGALFSFLPFLGVELLPIGLMLLAHDVPSLRAPAARLTMWMLDYYERALQFCRKQRTNWFEWWRCAKQRRRAMRRATARPRSQLATSAWASRSPLRHDRAA